MRYKVGQLLHSQNGYHAESQSAKFGQHWRNTISFLIIAMDTSMPTLYPVVPPSVSTLGRERRPSLSPGIMTSSFGPPTSGEPPSSQNYTLSDHSQGITSPSNEDVLLWDTSFMSATVTTLTATTLFEYAYCSGTTYYTTVGSTISAQLSIQSAAYSAESTTELAVTTFHPQAITPHLLSRSWSDRPFQSTDPTDHECAPTASHSTASIDPIGPGMYEYHEDWPVVSQREAWENVGEESSTWYGQPEGELRDIENWRPDRDAVFDDAPSQARLHTGLNLYPSSLVPPATLG